MKESEIKNGTVVYKHSLAGMIGKVNYISGRMAGGHLYCGNNYSLMPATRQPTNIMFDTTEIKNVYEVPEELYEQALKAEQEYKEKMKAIKEACLEHIKKTDKDEEDKGDASDR